MYTRHPFKIKQQHNIPYVCVCVVIGVVVMYTITLQIYLLHPPDNTVDTTSTFIRCSPVECAESTDSDSQLQCVQQQSSIDSPEAVGHKFAFATLMLPVPELPVEHYVRLASVLAYSARSIGKLPCSVDLVMLLAGDISTSQRTRLQEVGWNLIAVPNIAPPAIVMQSLPVTHRFYHMFSKFHVFNMTAYDAVLYTDSDAMVVGDISDMIAYYHPQMSLHNVFLAWAPDTKGHPLHNAGVMLIRPSTQITNHMMQAAHVLTFDGGWSEQAFLQVYFANSAMNIPTKYNAIPFEWNQTYNDMLDNDIRIFHFTYVKPKIHHVWEFWCWVHCVTPWCRAWSAANEQVRQLQTAAGNEAM